MKPHEVVLDEIDQKMTEIADEIFVRTQQILLDDGKVDTGTLLHSGNIINEYLHKQIIYSAEHSSYVNYGREPGSYVPIEPLITWVRRKLGVGDLKKAKSLAFAISKSIEERGIQPVFFIERAVDEVTR
jgi:hypothetical protein